jgi:two-component system, NarL family, nitrate/nitrite response regulator NarL
MAPLHSQTPKPQRSTEINPVKDARLNVGRPEPIKVPTAFGSKMPEPIRILIVDDHPLVRDGLRALLTSLPEFRVVADTGDGDEAIRLAKELQPDVMLLDFSMPKKSGLDVMRELNGAMPRLRTVLMTAGVQKLDMVRMLQQGVKGIVMKGGPTELLLNCMRKVHRGELWVGHDTVTDLLDLLAATENGHAPNSRRDFGLTVREREIVRMIVEGESNKAIAHRLSIAEDTVKHHLTSSFDKTGTSSRLELALFALQHGLT